MAYLLHKKFRPTAAIPVGSLWGSFCTSVVVPCFFLLWLPETLHVFAVLANPDDEMINETFNFVRQAIQLPVWVVAYLSLCLHDCWGFAGGRFL